MKDNETGFTLIESLLVIAVVVTLSIIILPSMLRTVQNIETAHFFKMLDSDILYIQNSALGQSKKNIRIKFFHDYYQVSTLSKGTKKQMYPKHMNLGHATYSISYSSSGTVKNPGAFMFYDHDKMYQVTFPLGKGRHYVETIR